MVSKGFILKKWEISHLREGRKALSPTQKEGKIFFVLFLLFGFLKLLLFL